MNEQIKKWNEKLKHGEFDLSQDEDLSLAIMNLVSLEEHAYFTAQKTGDSKYLDLLQKFRKTRTDLLKDIVTDPQGEEWCMSKHLLATTMRLIETGNKYYSQDQKQSEHLYDHAFDMYSLFWHINKPSPNSYTPTTKQQTPIQEKTGIIASARNYVKQAIDCCKEI